MRKSNFINNLILIFLIIICRWFIEFSYFNEIVIKYGYYGFEDNRTILSFIISWLIMFLFIIPIIKITKKEISLSGIIILVLSFLSIPSFTTLVYANFLGNKFTIMSTIYWMVIFTSYFFINKEKPKTIRFKIKSKNFDDKFALLLGLFSILIVFYISWNYTGFRINFNLDNVYDLRMEARTYNIPIILSYLFQWARSISIVLLAYSLYKKKYLTASIFFLSQILSFGVDALKSTLFMTLLTIVLYLFFNKKRIKKTYHNIIYGIVGLTFAGVVEKVFLKTSNIIEIIIRRMMIIPVYLNNCYIKYFSTNQPDYFRRSILKFFGIKSPYNNLEFTIGKLFFNRPYMRCNNGLIAEAVTNFGYIGIIIGPILLVIILRLMDRCTVGLNKKIIIITGIYFGIRLTDTFLTVGLFTHGFLITIIIMMMLRNTIDIDNS